jgi:hypothetical protein
MEWWSIGVLVKQDKLLVLQPTLQYSNTPSLQLL